MAEKISSAGGIRNSIKCRRRVGGKPSDKAEVSGTPPTPVVAPCLQRSDSIRSDETHFSNIQLEPNKRRRQTNRHGRKSTLGATSNVVGTGPAVTSSRGDNDDDDDESTPNQKRRTLIVSSPPSLATWNAAAVGAPPPCAMDFASLINLLDCTDTLDDADRCDSPNATTDSEDTGIECLDYEFAPYPPRYDMHFDETVAPDDPRLRTCVVPKRQIREENSSEVLGTVENMICDLITGTMDKDQEGCSFTSIWGGFDGDRKRHPTKAQHQSEILAKAGRVCAVQTTSPRTSTGRNIANPAWNAWNPVPRDRKVLLAGPLCHLPSATEVMTVLKCMAWFAWLILD